MPIDRFVAIVAATVGFFGVIFVILGTFRFSSDLIARLAAMPYGGFSLDRLKSLSKQKAHTATGTLLVFLGVGMQIYGLAYINEPWIIFADSPKNSHYFAVLLGIAVVVAVYLLNMKLGNLTEDRAKRAVLKTRLERALKQNPIGHVYWSSAVEGAESLLGMKRKLNEPVAEFLRRLALELRVPCPSDLRTEE
ncbi:MAG: hypothetical protein GTO40_24895 [Deltaproteobacteria bacterium]|nr:hypothetical protein [Deltaproteobacteria bacterium]